VFSLPDESQGLPESKERIIVAFLAEKINSRHFKHFGGFKFFVWKPLVDWDRIFQLLQGQGAS